MNEAPYQLSKHDRKLAILVDPDKQSGDALLDAINNINELAPDYILIGGSLVLEHSIALAAKQIKQCTDIPVGLFPGHFTHLTNHVDFIFLLSLISGRNADLLIGQHVQSALKLKQLANKLTPTGYMLIDSGKPTSVSYMSNTFPIPADKADIAMSTAIAGEALGLKQIYMDAGSGAKNPIEFEMISRVAKSIEIPLIIGGGIREVSHIEKCWNYGANLVVIGNGIEQNNPNSEAFIRALQTLSR